MSNRFSTLALLWVVAAACGGETHQTTPPLPGTHSGSVESGSSGGGSGTSGDTGESGRIVPLPPDPPVNCGDGTLNEDEECDDGNTDDGDGCASSCLEVEVGFACPQAGKPCHRIARCGDGAVVTPEICDDGNTDGGDGCAPNCQLEFGFKCQGEPSACTPTVCGDNKKEGAESCDDGNTIPFDGCSSSCQTEPDCSEGACKSQCGDGLVLGEACDDGNNADGDGCSADCKIEKGFECSQDLTCEKVDGKCILRVPAVFRDFEAGPDFEVNCNKLVTGIVEASLDAEGKPVLASNEGACIESAKSFGEWYRDSSRSKTHMRDILLFDNGKGGFVNRYGAKGEQWQAYTHYVWAAPTVEECAANGCVPCMHTAGKRETTGCTADLNVYDGTPLFFPLDDVESAEPRYRAKIPPQYFDTTWPYDDQLIPDAKPHNFYFTTEVTYWFKYDPAQAATLDFTGDDDVWVFVNGKLAVDLGGLHAPENGSVTIDASTASKFGLQDGGVYRISVFHAERKRDGSSFQLTLAGFKTSRSACTPVCGDGIVSLGEECDDGVNDGSYGGCTAECKLGAYCGDGVVQKEAGETCDDGKTRTATLCSSSCRRTLPPR